MSTPSRPACSSSGLVAATNSGRQSRRGEALAVVEDDGDDVLLGQLRRQGCDGVRLPEPALAKDEDVRVGRAAARVWVPGNLFAGLGV